MNKVDFILLSINYAITSLRNGSPYVISNRYEDKDTNKQSTELKYYTLPSEFLEASKKDTFDKLGPMV